jgi:hypothetical protein
LFAQLVFEVCQHAARDLRNQDSRIHAFQSALELRVLLADAAEIIGNLLERFEVEARISLRAFENRDQRLGRRVSVGHAHRGDRRIDVVYARLSGFHAGRRRKPGRGMALHVDRNVDRFLESADEFERDVRAQQPRHVLDADRVRAHVLDAFTEIDPQVNRVHGTYRVRDGSLGVLVDLDRRLDRRLEVPEIVQRVENPEDIDAVDRTALDELLHQVVSVMAVAENILAAKQHLLWRIRHGGFQAANALPRVFSEVANTGIEGRPAPGLDRPEADLVEFAGDRQHVVDPHTRRKQALVRVTKHEFGNTERFLFAHK